MSLSAANGGSSVEDGQVTRSKMGHRKNTQEVLQCQGGALCGRGSVHRAKRASGRVSGVKDGGGFLAGATGQVGS